MSTGTSQFYEALNKYQPDLKAFAFSLTRDLTESEDLVQDTMVKAIYFSDSFQQGTNLKSWLNTILKNTFCNNYKKRIRKNAVLVITDEISDYSMKRHSLQNAATDYFLGNDIKIALAAIDQTYAVPFMRFFEGYKYHEIADELCIPIGTVKTRIYLARKMLKQELSMYHDQFTAASYA